MSELSQIHAFLLEEQKEWRLAEERSENNRQYFHGGMVATTRILRFVRRLKRESSICGEDWNALLWEICKLYVAHFPDSGEADAEEADMDEFDPWQALRELSVPVRIEED